MTCRLLTRRKNESRISSDSTATKMHRHMSKVLQACVCVCLWGVGGGGGFFRSFHLRPLHAANASVNNFQFVHQFAIIIIPIFIYGILHKIVHSDGIVVCPSLAIVFIFSLRWRRISFFPRHHFSINIALQCDKIAAKKWREWRSNSDRSRCN